MIHCITDQIIHLFDVLKRDDHNRSELGKYPSLCWQKTHSIVSQADQLFGCKYEMGTFSFTFIEAIPLYLNDESDLFNLNSKPFPIPKPLFRLVRGNV